MSIALQLDTVDTVDTVSYNTFEPIVISVYLILLVVVRSSIVFEYSSKSFFNKNVYGFRLIDHFQKWTCIYAVSLL